MITNFAENEDILYEIEKVLNVQYDEKDYKIVCLVEYEVIPQAKFYDTNDTV